MNFPRTLLLPSLLISCLAGCGGSDGGAGTPASATTASPVVGTGNAASPAISTKVSPYLGEWYGGCTRRMREKVSISRDPAGGDRILVSVTSDHHQNIGCTGAVVATQGLDIPGMQVAITGSTNAGVLFAPGTMAVQSAIDLISASLPAHHLQVTGTTVTHTVKDGQAQWCIDFGGGNSTCLYDEGLYPAQTAVSGAIMVNENKLYIMWPAGSEYTADLTYSR
jgi:hypothetical protein